MVLASGIMEQIAGQSTISVSVCLDVGNERLEVLINNEPFCIIFSELPVGADGDVSILLTGDVYEGTCDDLGNLIGTFTGTLTGFSGGLEDEFTFVIDFTLTRTDGILHSKSKLTGAIVTEGPSDFRFENVESEYAYFESNGVRVNLRLIGLEPESGTVTFEVNGVTRICLPTFIFAIEAPVGGIVIPMNKLAVIIPYLTLVGLVAAVSTVYIFKKRKK
ncbi:hypothetical protein ACFLQ6_00265 [Thermoproteota archaeon]